MKTLQQVISSQTDINKLQESVDELNTKKKYLDSECIPQIEEMEEIIKNRINFLIANKKL